MSSVIELFKEWEEDESSFPFHHPTTTIHTIDPISPIQIQPQVITVTSPDSTNFMDLEYIVGISVVSILTMATSYCFYYIVRNVQKKENEEGEGGENEKSFDLEYNPLPWYHHDPYGLTNDEDDTKEEKWTDEDDDEDLYDEINHTVDTLDRILVHMCVCKRHYCYLNQNQEESVLDWIGYQSATCEACHQKFRKFRKQYRKWNQRKREKKLRKRGGRKGKGRREQEEDTNVLMMVPSSTSSPSSPSPSPLSPHFSSFVNPLSQEGTGTGTRRSARLQEKQQKKINNSICKI